MFLDPLVNISLINIKLNFPSPYDAEIFDTSKIFSQVLRLRVLKVVYYTDIQLWQY